MKATEQYFPVVLCIMLYKVVLTFESVDKIIKCTVHVKIIKKHFPVVLFIILHQVVQTVLFCSTVHFLVHFSIFLN